MKSPIKSLKKLRRRIRNRGESETHERISEEVSGDEIEVVSPAHLQPVSDEGTNENSPFKGPDNAPAPHERTVQFTTPQESIFTSENIVTKGQTSTPPVEDPPKEAVPPKDVIPPLENGVGPQEVPSTPVEEDVKKTPETPPKEGVIYDVHAKSILLGVLVITGLFWSLLGFVFGFSFWEFTRYTFIFAGLSLLYLYLYFKNQQRKDRDFNVLNISPGVMGLHSLLGEFPSWLSYTKKERVEWFNKTLTQMWPFYDKAVCDAIKESVEPIMKSVKPPIFKHIKFRTLRFGVVPFRVEGVEVEESETEVIIDLDLRWSGDATVSLAIEPNIPSMADATTMCPKVTDVSCSGTLRLVLKPLVSEIPGFGAITASFLKAPSLHFHCDFGKALGGNMSGKMVRSALDPFIKDTLASMLVWPHRMVIPVIYDEDITGPLDELELRHVGILTVKVIEAKNLPAADTNGYSDPTIELWTRPEKKYDTAVIKKTLNPVWEDEIHHLLLQEPKTQHLHLTAYDVDMLNVSDVFKSMNIIKNLRESVHAKELLGRSLVPLREVTEQEAEETDGWFDFGHGDFGDLHGPGSGCGSVHLKLIYTPFKLMKVENSKIGAVLIDVVKCRDLVPMDASGTSDPYVKIKLGQQVFKTQVIRACCDPEFHCKYEVFDVPITERIEVAVFDRDRMSKDDPIGDLMIDVQEVADSQWSEFPGQLRQWFPLDRVPRGEIELKLQYIPMDTIKPFSC